MICAFTGESSIKLTLEKFTLIGATIRAGLLGSPFRDRFGFISRMNLYSVQELVEVVSRSAMLGIDRLGLDKLDRKILGIIAQDFGGGPVGVKTIAISAGEEVRTIEEVYEPYLIQIGFIKRTPQGREKKQLELIYKSIEKIERMGKNSIKLLQVRDKYILGEIKFMNPPYRLYVIINQEDETFYIVKWEHKEKQQKVINQLTKKLEYAFEGGIKNIMELFSH